MVPYTGMAAGAAEAGQLALQATWQAIWANCQVLRWATRGRVYWQQVCRQLLLWRQRCECAYLESVREAHGADRMDAWVLHECWATLTMGQGTRH